MQPVSGSLDGNQANSMLSSPTNHSSSNVATILYPHHSNSDNCHLYQYNYPHSNHQLHSGNNINIINNNNNNNNNNLNSNNISSISSSKSQVFSNSPSSIQQSTLPIHNSNSRFFANYQSNLKILFLQNISIQEPLVAHQGQLLIYQYLP